MIRLAGSTRTFKSPRMTLPTLHTGTNHTVFVINHNLGVTPDHVDVLFEDGRIMYDVLVSGANNLGYLVDNTNPVSLTLWLYRYAVGDFYVVVTSFANSDFDFS